MGGGRTANSWKIAFAIHVVAVSTVSGCIGVPRQQIVGADGGDSGSYSVVALIDSGINPYHDAFRASEGSADVERFARNIVDSGGRGPTVVQLTQSGEYRERRRADAPFWDNLTIGELYAFKGTRVLGISLRDHDSAAPLVEDANIGHGTGTAGLVARDDEFAIVVMVDVVTGFCATDGGTGCLLHPSIARGMEWASHQPWIDIISVSLGLPANHPDDPAVHPEMQTYLEASESAHASGKLIINAAGNHVAPAIADYFNGPPWVVNVGGFEPSPRGESALAGKAPDVVANFTDWFALAGSVDGYAWGAGTSYATPIVAGTLSKALRLVREALGSPSGIRDGALAVGNAADGTPVRVTSADLRAAINASAAVVGPTEWDPTNPTAKNDTLHTLVGASVPVVVPFAQTGWGYVHAGLAEEVARRVLAGELVNPEKEVTAAWMGAVQAAREAYWERYE